MRLLADRCEMRLGGLQQNSGRNTSMSKQVSQTSPELDVNSSSRPCLGRRISIFCRAPGQLTFANVTPQLGELQAVHAGK